LDYLKKTDVLLQQYDDFALSGTGFEKYKVAHLAAVNFLTQLYRQKEKQKEKREQEKENKSMRFYFFSREKHIQQQTETIPWSFAFFHFILLLISTAALMIGSALIVILTQKNGIVLVLSFLSFSAFMSIAKKIRKKYRESALTPVRFTISLLSICSLTTVLYALIFIVMPVFIAWEYKPFWRDDVIIIGLGIFAFIIFCHTQDNSEETVKLGEADNENKVSKDSVKVVDVEGTKQCND